MERPEAIIITYPLYLLKRYGDYKSFREGMLELNDENAAWFQRCRNKPKHEVPFVFIVVGGKIRFRLNCAGWDPGTPARVVRPDGTPNIIQWPRLVLTGPVVEAPGNIEYKGFQGFRYTDTLFF